MGSQWSEIFGKVAPVLHICRHSWSLLPIMHVALYICSIYIVLGILSHQGTICNIQGDARVYANTMPFYVRISVPTYVGIWEILELTLFFFNVSVHICAHEVELLGV